MKIILSALMLLGVFYGITIVSFLLPGEMYKKFLKISVPVIMGIIIFMGIYGIYLLFSS